MWCRSATGDGVDSSRSCGTRHALCGAFLAGFRVRGHRRALGTRQRTFLGPLRGFAGFLRQMCRNRLLPVVVWVRFGVETLVRQL